MAGRYAFCACRDCSEVTVADEGKPALCPSCDEAGCTIHENLPGFIAGYGLGHECQRIDMYV